MRILTLWQPWASLVAVGLKRWETRPRSLGPYKGDVVIQAGLEQGQVIRQAYDELRAATAPWREVAPELAEALALALDGFGPFGVALSVVHAGPSERQGAWHFAGLTDRERLFGGWAPGRWALPLTNLRDLAVPLPMRGCQGLRSLSEADAEAVRALERDARGLPGQALRAAREQEQAARQLEGEERAAVAAWRDRRVWVADQAYVGGGRWLPACLALTDKRPGQLRDQGERAGRVALAASRAWWRAPLLCSRCGCSASEHAGEVLRSRLLGLHVGWSRR